MKLICSGVVGVDAEDGAGHLGASGAHQACQRHDLSGADFEADVAEDPGPAESVDFQDRIPDLGNRLGEQRLDVAAHHLADDLRDGDVGGPVGGNVPAVPHDGDPVAQVEDLVEAVRNEEDAGSLVPEAAGDGEQALHFNTAQGGRRLVHHQHFGVERDGLGDFDDLLVRDGQALGNPCGIDGNAKPFEELARLPDHGCLADQAEPALGLAADEDVLRDAEVREERGLLVDDGDSGGLAVADVAELDALARPP